MHARDQRLLDRLSFRSKLAAIITFLVIGICSATLWRVEDLSRKFFLDRFVKDARKAHEATERNVNQRLTQLQAAAEQLAENPRLLAVLATDDPGTLQDLIADEAEGFTGFFRERDCVLLYKKSDQQAGRWVMFDNFGALERPSELERSLGQLDAEFAKTGEKGVARLYDFWSRA